MNETNSLHHNQRFLTSSLSGKAARRRFYISMANSDQHPRKLNEETTPRHSPSMSIDVNFFNPRQPLHKGSGNLPHLTQEGVAYFVTFRLADSLPQSKLSTLKRQREQWLQQNPRPHNARLRREYYLKFVKRVDKWLDAGAGDCVLEKHSIRETVVQAFHYFAGQRYLLGPFVVMPNHVHVIFSPIAPFQLDSILHSWKSFTAKQINRRLRRTGALWQKESFDHIIRSADEFENKTRYIIRNPRYLEKHRYTLGVNVEEASRLFAQYSEDGTKTTAENLPRHPR